MAWVETAIIECPDCSANVAATLLHAYEARFGEHGEEDVRYTLLKCPRCDRPFLCAQDGFVDHDDQGEMYQAWTTHGALYPKPVNAPDASVPKPIAASYIEAQHCLRAGAATATAIMCRRTPRGALRSSRRDEREPANEARSAANRGRDRAPAF